jgi:hypothetical protein
MAALVIYSFLYPSLAPFFIAATNSGKQLLGSKALIFGVVSILQVVFKRALVNQPGFSQLYARQPTSERT